MKLRPKTIYLPHLHYTVRLRYFQQPPQRIAQAKAWIKRDDRNGCTIYFAKRETPCSLAHELVHALCYICEDRNMQFTEEFEHMAYLMQYLMGQALGYEWVGGK